MKKQYKEYEFRPTWRTWLEDLWILFLYIILPTILVLLAFLL